MFKLKKLLKYFVKILQKIMPEKAFDSFYDFAFPLYKDIIRGLYGLKAPLYSILGGKETAKMSKRVHDIMPYSLVGIGGLETTYLLTQKVIKDKLEGDLVELGVYKGGCAGLIGMAAYSDDSNFGMEKTLWLFDSYEGLPDPTEDDYLDDGAETGEHVRPLPKGSCLGTLDEVKWLLFEKLKLPEAKIEFVKGWFQDTLPVHKEKIEKISLLRLDGDWYESTKVCFEHLYDKVVPGGAVIIDDYLSCYGSKKAVDEFLSNRGLSIDLTMDGRGGCYFLKGSD